MYKGKEGEKGIVTTNGKYPNIPLTTDAGKVILLKAVAVLNSVSHFSTWTQSICFLATVLSFMSLD